MKTKLFFIILNYYQEKDGGRVCRPGKGEGDPGAGAEGDDGQTQDRNPQPGNATIQPQGRN